MKAIVCFAICLSCVSCAFAQVDAFSLQTKYGAPLDRETFTVRPGIEMVVDYGPNKQACRIRLPSGRQIVGTVSSGIITKQQIDEVLNEVVPPSIRGKEINGGVEAFGLPMLVFTEYEHVTISEMNNGGDGQGITVVFKDSACPKQRVQQ